MHNVEVIEIKSFSFKNISLKVQLFLLIVLIGCFIAYFFVDPNIMIPIIYGVLALMMLVMAYNNKVYYKRKYLGIVYIILSITLIINLVVELIW